MLKQLILFFHLIFMSFVTIFLSDGIEIETNLPSELVKDSTYIVDVVIKKGDLFGFAKYQQNFPEGFDAKPVETAEASFTFADGKMKFIWMALPESPEVKITYALTAHADAPEEAPVDGKFSYIHENERKSYDIPNQTIRVIAPLEESAPKVPALAEVSRTVEPLGNNRYKVNLAIEKQGVYGFAKLEEYLPAGAEAEVGEGQKSVFSQVDERAKFVWMSIPDNAVLNISYHVKASSDILNALNVMEGSFAFLDENETKTVAVLGTELEAAASIAQVEEVESAPETKVKEPMPEERPEQVEEEVAMVEEEVVEAKEETPAVAVVEEQPVKAEAPKAVEEKVASNVPVKPAPAPVTKVPTPETGITYKVQIAAGHKVVEESFLRKTYKFDEQYIIENHEGWVKYITGQFNVYKQARDKREALVAAKHEFPGPFVTAYNDGERITVQEALMISNQQWFK
jgi:hypothetical protein